MGAAQSSGYSVADFDADPASFPAGTAVRLKSDGTISKTKADGSWIGVSAGRSLSSTKRLSVVTDGRGVPMLVERQPARGSVTITSYANLVATTPDTLAIAGTTLTAQSGAATPGQAVFRAATSNAATATSSLAAQINAHATLGALVFAAVDSVDNTKVNLTAILAADATADTYGIVYTDNHSDIGLTVSGATFVDSDDTPDFITIGAKVYISDDSGKVDDASSVSTISDAIFASGLLTGIDEDGNSVLAVLVDFPGGL
jgi:hypothetical protein